MDIRSLKRAILLLSGVALGAIHTMASASTLAQYADAQVSDPATLGWMVGAPPPADRVVRFDDGSYFRFPQWRWSVSIPPAHANGKCVAWGGGSIASQAEVAQRYRYSHVCAARQR